MLSFIDLYRLTRPNSPKCDGCLGRLVRGEVGRVGGMSGGHSGRRRADQAGSTAIRTRLTGPAAQMPPQAPPGSYNTVESYVMDLGTFTRRHTYIIIVESYSFSTMRTEVGKRE